MLSKLFSFIKEQFFNAVTTKDLLLLGWELLPTYLKVLLIGAITAGVTIVGLVLTLVFKLII